jgi:Phage head-tail joining protein
MTLSTAELTAMRATGSAYLPDTCTIQRATTTQDSMGGESQSFATLASSVACRMDEPVTGGSEQAIDMAVGTAVKFIMHLAYNQDITVKDRVVYSSSTYEVSEVLDSASWLITRRVVLMRTE